jgi:uncharacterized protein YbjQ (UPF0145 family)
MAINNEMITTTFELPGYKITKNLGVVRGISVRSPGTFGNMKAGLQSMFAGKVDRYTQLCEETREEAYRTMKKKAEKLRANAIIGYRYDANEIALGVTEVLAYGTAVMVEKQ